MLLTISNFPSYRLAADANNQPYPAKFGGPIKSAQGAGGDGNSAEKGNSSGSGHLPMPRPFPARL
ncbi:hypothetical protein PLICRDRAFT_38765 [Plicaturopsis crispa FD-325 SS-3]|nr:hypothetical protein PLICRDRAFT_38765 [Plicaturopsis crispa FD-325 SS-3]